MIASATSSSRSRAVRTSWSRTSACAAARCRGEDSDHRRLPRERGSRGVLACPRAPRCTASTARTGTSSAAVAARTARWRASRTRADVWDGAVPFIHGTPMSMPSMFSVQAHAFRVLMRQARRRSSTRSSPAGAATCTRASTSRSATRWRRRRGWASRSRAWFDAERVALQYTTVWAGLVRLGGQVGPDVLRRLLDRARLPRREPDRRRSRRPSCSTRRRSSSRSWRRRRRRLGLPLPLAMARPARRRRARSRSGSRSSPTRTSPARCCSSRRAARPVTTCGSPACSTAIVTTGIGQEQFDALRGVAVGDDVMLDNTAYLAFQTYHRHQVPADEYPEWDQFRAAGQPIYPQRPQLLGPRYGAQRRGGGIQAGRFAGKMIVVQCLLRRDRVPAAGVVVPPARPGRARRLHRRSSIASGSSTTRCTAGR